MNNNISTQYYSPEVCSEMNKYHSLMKQTISVNISVLERLKEVGITAVSDQTIEKLKQDLHGPKLYRVHPVRFDSPPSYAQMHKPLITLVCKGCGQEFSLSQDYLDRLKAKHGEKFGMPCRCKACKQALATKAA